MFDQTMLLLAEGAGPLGGMLPFILMIGVFYFLVLRPMKKQEDQRKTRLAELKRGDRVVMTGGLLGRISRVEDDIVILEIADKVKIRVLKKDVADFEEAALAAAAKDRGTKSDKDKAKADKSEKDKSEKDKSEKDKSEKSADSGTDDDDGAKDDASRKAG